MRRRRLALYHLFFVLAALNLLFYYLIVGQSTIALSSDRRFFADSQFNYYFCVTALILLTWLGYCIYYGKTTSRKIIWTHLVIVVFATFILPTITDLFIPQMPRRYIENHENSSLLDFLGNAKLKFLVVTFALIGAEILVIKKARERSTTQS